MSDAQSDLARHLDALGRARVLVVGDIMLDRFVYGGVERVSPEGPIPVLRIEREAAMLGGAGNVLRNLAALGVACDLVAIVGDDTAGRAVRKLARDAAGEDARILVQPGRPTTVKERFVAAGQQLLRADRESDEPADAETAAALIAAATAALADAGALLLSDYGKGVLRTETLAALMAAARDAGCPVIVDPKGRDFGRYRGASLITPNLKELAEATGMPTAGDKDIALAAQQIIDTCGVGAVLVTRGAGGMTLLEARGEGKHLYQHLPVQAREVYDVSGAGDTVAATVAAGLAAGVDLVDAVRLANAAAGLVVGKLGTAVADRDELRRSLRASDLLAAESKIVALDTVIEQVERWRQKGLSVGFTNGCFDLLHPGHVSLLDQARAACDRLIVGLNSDASIRRLKQAGRPVQPEAARAAVLASLAAVDRVVVFAEDTPIKLIEAIRPDVLAKGADYTLDQVVGADVVQAYGGRIVLAELLPGHSTTRTIEKLSG